MTLMCFLSTWHLNSVMANTLFYLILVQVFGAVDFFFSDREIQCSLLKVLHGKD